MFERLDGTAALITGASSGIGQAAAVQLAAQGAAVALVARRRDRLDDLVARIAAAGGSALALDADVTVIADATEAITAAVSHFGRLDTLVNAAGVMLLGPTLESRWDEWQRMIDLNLTGLLAVTKAALPHLVDAATTSPRGVADVVNISSTAGRIAKATAAIYNATKFGVTAATEAWRQEFTRRNVRFSVIEPGAVDTELFDQQTPEIKAGYDNMFLGIERLHADDIANAISYIVTSPRRVAVNEILIRPTDQT